VTNLALSWQQGSGLAVGLAVLAVGLRFVPPLPRWSRGRMASAIAAESAIIAVLYALWQLAGSISLVGTAGAFARARWIVHFERGWLPEEVYLQRWVLPHPWLAQFCNLYYASMHFIALGVLLLWVFLRHRDAYPHLRVTVVLLTLTCLLIQLMPVAPPRLLSQYGFVDLAAHYGQSVYGTFGAAGIDQLSAMPSVHVGWAVLVGLTAVRVSPSRWRWLVLAHPIVTIFVVVATANHFWLDGIVAVVLLAGVEGALMLVARLWTRVQRSRAPANQRALVTSPAGESTSDLVPSL
jgi:hypothetical protein